MIDNRELFKNAAARAREDATKAGRLNERGRPDIMMGDIVRAAYELGVDAGRV